MISYKIKGNDKLSYSHLKVLIFENTGNSNSLPQEVN